MNRRYVFFSLLSAILLLALVHQPAMTAETKGTHQALSSGASVIRGTRFIENRGQWADSVLYLTQRGGMDMWILPNAFVYDVYKLRHMAGQPVSVDNFDPQPTQSMQREGHVFRMTFLNASPATAEGNGLQPTYHNYFIGNDPAKWASKVPLYSSVRLNTLYPGIDAVVYDDDGSPRYDLVVHPGASAKQIAIGIEGATNWLIDNNGNLQIKTAVGTVTHGKLFAYQETRGKKQQVECRFVITGEGAHRTLGFETGAYDRSLPLIIDPLIYSTYLGGTSNTYDVAHGVQVDAAGYAYVTGYTNAPTFPPEVGTYNPPLGTRNSTDVFLSKVDVDGSSLIYLTFIGGSGDDQGRDIALDQATGDIYLTGFTNSNNFYVINAFQPTIGSPNEYDAFITKLNNDGNAALFSTYVGGNGIDKAYAVDFDGSGVAITGYSRSTNYPLSTPAYDNVGDPLAADIIITKLSAAGALQYSTYFGITNSLDLGYDISAQGANLNVVGYTKGGFQVPAATYSLDRSFSTNANISFSTDGFALRLNTATNSLPYYTYIGGLMPDYAVGIAADNNYLYLTGNTASSTNDGFPVTPNAYSSTFTPNNFDPQAGDAFLIKLDVSQDGSPGLLYSTYIGGDSYDFGQRLAISGSNVYVVGATISQDFDVKPNPGAYFTSLQSGYDLFFAKFDLAQNNTASLVYSTYFGGSDNDGTDNNYDFQELSSPLIGLAHQVIANKITVAGFTETSHLAARPFPISALDPYKSTYGGNRDAFVTQFELDIDRIIVTSPTTETAKCAGDFVDVNWTATAGIKRVLIDLSNASGVFGSAPPIADITLSPPSPYTWRWNIPANQAPGTYKIQVRDFSNGTIVSTTAIITVKTPPVITIQPQDVDVCIGQPVSIPGASATGTDLTYTWYQVGNSSPVFATTTPAQPLSLGNATLAMNGTQYYVVVSNDVCAAATSNTVTISVKEPPTVTGPSVSVVVLCEGQSTTLTISTTGTDVTVEWEYQRIGFGTWDPYPSAPNSNTLALASVSKNLNGSKFRAKVSNGCGTVYSSIVTLTVNWAPSIIDPPALSNPVCEGEELEIEELTYDGSPTPNVQWTVLDKSGNDVTSILTDNTSDEIDGPAVQAAWDGYRFYATISNACGVVTTNTLMLQVLAKPTIIPSTNNSFVLCEGDRFEKTVLATGASLSYQWFKVGSGSVAGATSSKLVFDPVDPIHAGRYYVEVRNLQCPLHSPATSAIVTLVVKTKPRITQDPQPAFDLVCTGATYSITAAATGTNATFQWQKYNSQIGAFVDITGATVLTFNIASVKVSDAGRYRVVVSGDCSPSATSLEAVLEVGVAPVVQTSPTPQTVCEGESTSFDVVVDPTTKPDPIIYWEVSTDNGAIWSTVATLTMPTTQYSVANITAGMNGYLYRAKLVNTCDSALSTPALLTVNTKPVVQTSPTPQTVCEGESTSFDVVVDPATRPDPIIYWEVSTDNGATWSTVATLTMPSTQYSVANITAGMNGYLYRAKLVNTCDSALSTPALLTVNTKPVVQTSPTPQTVCEGESTSFDVVVDPATRPDPIIYWEVSIDNGTTWTTVATLTMPSTQYSVANITAGMNGYLYRAKLVNTCDSALSTPALLTVNTKPVVQTSPTPQTVCEGESTSFDVVVDPTTKPDPIIYWEVSTDNGATWSTVATLTMPTTQYSVANITAGMNGYLYRAKLVNTCDSALSTPALLTVNTKPVVQTSPTPQTVCEGESTSFDVVVDPATRPDPIIYWEVSTDNGATWSTVATLTMPSTQYSVANITAGMNGYLYRAKLVNTCDSALSTPALLTVNTKPVVQASPTPKTVCEGESTSFDVVVDPTTKPDPIIYWEVSTDNGATWSTVATLTMPSTQYSVANITAGMNGYLYRAKLVNTCDSALSTPALLTVNTKPVVQTSPTPQTVCEGESTSFDVVVDPTTKPDPIIYWEVSTDNGATWSTVATLTMPTTQHSVANITAGMNGYLYRAKLVNTCDSALSTPALLTVNTKPIVQVSPTPKTVCEGESTSFDVVVDPTTKPDPIIYWEVSTDNGTTWTTVATLTFPNTQLDISNVTAGMNGYLYRAKLVNSCDSALSNTALLTVNTKPVVKTSPESKTVCEGQSTIFSVEVEPTTKPDPVIYWEVSINSGGSWSTVATLTFPNTQLDVNDVTAGMNGNLYRAVIINPCGTAISTSAVLTVYTKPVVTITPSNKIVCEGSIVTFEAFATGIPTPNIVWEVSTNSTVYVPIAEGGQYSGTTTNILTINNVLSEQDGYYFRAVFSNQCGQGTSASALLTVKTLPRITGSPTSATICVGEPYSFTVEATGSNLHYQWQKNGVNIPDASGLTYTTYTIPAVEESDAGVYTVVVSGPCPQTALTSATLNVNAPPKIIEQPTSATVCEGNDIEFWVQATGANISYQWYKNGQAITGATLSTLSLTDVDVSDEGMYYVEVHGICPVTPATSSIAQLTVNTSPRITNNPLSRSICEGETVIFSVAVSGTAPQFQWRKDGKPIAGATGGQLTLNNITQVDAGNYDVVVIGTCPPPVTSSVATLTVNAAPQITQHPKDTIICEGETLVLTVQANGAGRTFQWRKNGVEILAPEGTSQNYTLPGITDAANGVYDVIVSGTCQPPDTSLQANVRVQRPPQLTNTPSFPTVSCLGGSSRDTLVIFNPGAAPISMNAAAVNNSRFVIVDPVGPFDIPAGASKNIIVEFRPTRAGTEIASVNLTSVRCNSQILAQLSARADSIRIVSLPEVRFKSAAQCDGPDVQDVLVENTGDVEVRITPSFSDSQFALDNPADSPIILPSGSSKRVRVRFTSNGVPNTSITATMRLTTEQCSFETTTILRAGSIRVAYEATVPGGVLDFGTLAGCKTNSSLTFKVKNTGNAVVSITSATTTNPAFGAVLPQTPLVLGVGSTATITVQFGAGPPGSVSGKLILRSGNPCPKDTTFDLVGSRGDVAIAPDVQTVAYGKLLSCVQTSRDTVIVITNNGTEDASFGAPNIQAPFAITDVQPTPGFPRTLKAGASIRVRVSFAPGADGSYSSIARFPYQWGECTDTLNIPLTGAISTPQLQADVNIIDFGALLGCEGTLDTTLILVNNGSEDMVISDIQDPAGYRIKDLLSSSLPLTIPANGGTVEIRIRFAPPAPGVYNQLLVLTAQPCDVKLSIALRGEKQGVSFSDVPSDVIDFGTIVNCNGEPISPKSFTINNTSDGDVEGRVTYTVTGPFTTTLQQNTVLKKGNPVPFDVVFTPSGNGLATGELKLFYEPCGITRTIALRGTITYPALVNSGTTVFGDQTVNTTSGQRVVTFTNSGSTTLTITAIDQPAAPFTVVSVTPALPAVLKPGELLTVVLTFTPTDDIVYNDILQVHSSTPCTISSQIAMEGRGTNAPQPNITFKGLDFGQVYVTMSRAMKVTITNDGQDDGQIFNITSDDPQFTVETLNYPISIPKDKSIEVEVTFSPATPGIKTAKLKVLSDGGSPEDIIRGEGIPLPKGTTVLSMPALTAEAGTENFALPVRLTNQQNLPATESITSLKFTVSFNGTLFYPVRTSKGTITNNDFDETTHTRTITVELLAADFNGIPSAGDLLTEIYGNVLLGNSETTALTFSNIEWEVGLGSATATPENGTLTLTNVCRVGGARLIKLNKAHSITSITPNPASDVVEIVAEVPVVGPAALEIYSITGELVYAHHWTVSRTTTAASTATVLMIPTTELPSGTYQVILRSKERVDSQRLVIVK